MASQRVEMSIIINQKYALSTTPYALLINDKMYINTTLTTVFDSHLSKKLMLVRQKYSAKSIKSKTKTQVTNPPHQTGGLLYFFIFLLSF